MRSSSVTNTIIMPALKLLPEHMYSQYAIDMLLAIGYQESKFVFRRQMNGPARGFWQFEVGGIKSVLNHHSVGSIASIVLRELRLPFDASRLHDIFEFNDIIACCFARLLLWSDPSPLPDLIDPDQHEIGWEIYKRCWRPGKPHHELWPASVTYACKVRQHKIRIEI